MRTKIYPDPTLHSGHVVPPVQKADEIVLGRHT